MTERKKLEKAGWLFIDSRRVHNCNCSKDMYTNNKGSHLHLYWTQKQAVIITQSNRYVFKLEEFFQQIEDQINR